MDTIGNMFTSIRNAYAVKKETVIVPYSKFKMEVAKLLEKEGYIKDVIRRGRKNKRSIELVLKYRDGKPAISQIKRVSKCSRRIYCSVKEIYPIRSGQGMRIFSTSKGVLSGKEARDQKVGGEVIGELW